MKTRLGQHVRGNGSAFHANFAELLGNDDLLNQIIDDVYFECIATSYGEEYKADLLANKYRYLLNKD